MRFFLTLIATLFAGALAAEPVSLDSVTLDDGRVLTIQRFPFDAELQLDGQSILEDAGVEMFDAGEAGILVQTWHGGNSCPYSFRLMDKTNGEFRQINLNGDRPEVFAECEGLISVIPELATILTERYSTRNMAKGYIWYGYALEEFAVPIMGGNAPEPEPGDMVTRWNGEDPYDFLRDPVEQKRLLRVISEVQFDDLSWLMSFRSPAYVEGDYLLMDGCVKYLCDAQNAIVAVRVSDGQPFVRIYDDGAVTLGGPAGEELPPAIQAHAARYP